MARSEKRLTAKQVAGATAPGSYADGGGLTLEVDVKGRRAWVWRYRRAGRRREMGLGPAHEVGLAEARAERDRWRATLRGGVDPIDERGRMATTLAPAIATFGEVADAYIAEHRASWLNPKHADQWAMTLREYAKPIRGKPVGEVTTQDILGVLKPIWQSVPETASRLRGRLEVILDAARAAGHIPEAASNPARWRGHLDKLLARRTRRSRGHFAAMPWLDVPAFVAALRAESSISALALEFTILTGARSGETRLAAPAEFDLDAGVWIVPAARMKAGRAHAVPLTARVVEIVRELREAFPHSPFVFPSLRKPRAPVSDMTLTAFLRRRGLEFTTHGFRSSFRDWVWEATNFPRDLAEAALAHGLTDQTEAAYRRGGALERRRELMDAWANFIGGQHGATILPLRRSTPRPG